MVWGSLWSFEGDDDNHVSFGHLSVISRWEVGSSLPACGFLCFAFPIPKSPRVGLAGKGPVMSSISTLSGPGGSKYHAQDKVGTLEPIDQGD